VIIKKQGGKPRFGVARSKLSWGPWSPRRFESHSFVRPRKDRDRNTQQQWLAWSLAGGPPCADFTDSGVGDEMSFLLPRGIGGLPVKFVDSAICLMCSGQTIGLKGDYKASYKANRRMLPHRPMRGWDTGSRDER